MIGVNVIERTDFDAPTARRCGTFYGCGWRRGTDGAGPAAAYGQCKPISRREHRNGSDHHEASAAGKGLNDSASPRNGQQAHKCGEQDHEAVR